MGILGVTNKIHHGACHQQLQSNLEAAMTEVTTPEQLLQNVAGNGCSIPVVEDFNKKGFEDVWNSQTWYSWVERLVQCMRNFILIVARKHSQDGCRVALFENFGQDRAIQLRQLGFVLACIRCGDLAGVRVEGSGSLNFSYNSASDLGPLSGYRWQVTKMRPGLFNHMGVI